MSAVRGWPEASKQRAIVLWACTGLFFLRVIGQIEVLLVSPSWLPPMEDWYSGLLPYPILLPAQIVLLMVMAVISAYETQNLTRLRDHGARWRRVVRVFAVCYFGAMLLRLAIQLLRGADNVIAAGGIPVAFHCVLALFLLVLARPTTPLRQPSHAARRPPSANEASAATNEALLGRRVHDVR